MAKQGIVRSFFGSLVNVRKWSGFDEVISNAKFVAGSLRNLCTPVQKKTDAVFSTFEEWAQKSQLTDEEIQKRAKYFLYYSIVYAIAALCLLFYVGYLIYSGGRILSILVTIVLTTMMFVYALREHVCYMQLKTRKLGFNFKEWVVFLFFGAKQ